MSDIEMACIRLKDALDNKSAQERYTTMKNSKYVHPGWVDKRALFGGNHGKNLQNK